MLGQSKAGDPRVRRLLESLNYRFEIDRDGDYTLTMRLSDDRTQVAYINSNTETSGGLEIREVYSVGYILDSPPSEQLANFLLRDNGKVKMGAWRISGGDDGGRCALVFAAHLGADCDSQTLDTVLGFVLRHADNFEKKLFETDKY